MFENQEIDIAVAPMIMTADREEVIDFVEPTFGQTGISIGSVFCYIHDKKLDKTLFIPFQI